MSTAIDIAVPFDIYGKQIMEQFNISSDQLFLVIDDAKKIGKDISHKLRETILFHYNPIEAIENG